MEYNLEDKLKNKKEKIVQIEKNGKVYFIDICLTFGRYKRYFEIADINNFEKAFNEIFLVDIDKNKFDTKDIEFIVLEIIKYHKLEELYNKINEDNIYKKLYDTLYEYQKQSFNKIKEVISSSITVVLKDMNNNFGKIFEKLNKSLVTLSNNLNNTFSKMAKSFPTKKDIERIKKSHSKWGKMGWTIIPTMDINYFYIAPKNQKEADEKCLSIFKDKDLNSIIEYIEKNIIHKSKFKEAVNCYNNKYYVATAMILVSLIERKITELPLKNKSDKKARGKMLISTYKDGLNIVDGDIIDLYYLENISSYLNMFFENGNDFKRQRYNVNRNFLMHGWRDVKTTKVDCIKLFLALYNVIMLWENRTI